MARRAAESSGHATIALASRDMDVPLSPAGEEQATALGHWFGRMPADRRPNVVLTSPYLRAHETTRRLLRSSGIPADDYTLVVDERLREKEFGVLDRLTLLGVRQKYPEYAEALQSVGKFYYRPPGGESWCDVILRLRSVLDTLSREYCGDRVLIVAHQVVVHCFRYLLEGLTEEEVLAIDRTHNLANCSVTSYEYDPDAGHRGKLRLQLFNFVAPLEAVGADVTREPDVPVAPK